MVWAIAAIITVIAVYRFTSEPSRKARALCLAALRARKRRNWVWAAQFYGESHELASGLKEPLRSKLESQIEIQWAAILYRQGKLREAEDMMQRGIAKGEQHYAPQSEMLLQGYLGWGDLCADQGKLQEAEGHYRKALEGDEASDNLAGIMFDLQRLGECLLRQERREEAARVILRSISLETRHARKHAVKQGLDPDQYQLTPISLPNLHICREEYEDARRLLRVQVEHWETQADRPDNIDIGQMRMQLALAEARTGHLEEAVAAYEQAAATFEREWCEGHPKAMAARQAQAALGLGITFPAGH